MDNETLRLKQEIEDKMVLQYLMSVYAEDIKEIRYNHGVIYLDNDKYQSKYNNMYSYISYRVLDIFERLNQWLRLGLRDPYILDYICGIHQRMIDNTAILYDDIAHLRLYAYDDNVPNGKIFIDSFPYFNDSNRR